jgi:Glycosyl transferase 4-like domain
MKGAGAVSRWSLSRVSPDDPSPAGTESSAGTGSPAGGDESTDLSSRLVQQAAELREARSDQVAAWVRLIRAEDRAAALDWQLESIRASRGYRLIRVLRQARSARALLRMPLDGLRVLTTAAPRPPRPADPGLRGRAEHTQDGWEAYDRRDYETALAEASAVLAGHPKDYAALDLRQSAHWQRGDIAATVSALSQMRMVHDSPQVARRERMIIGSARELDPRWLPRVPGPPRPVEPREGAIMHLLKESIPYLDSGFTMRGRDTAACQRLGGLDPFVVTSLGFPRLTGVTGFPPVDVIDGTPYHRLDAGPDYPLHQAADVVLGDTAWLAGRIGREQRPSVIHAMTGPQGFGTALVGLALREHLGRPLVCDVRSLDETTGTDDITLGRRGEHHEAHRATEIHCMRAADLVVTATEGMRSEIIDRGIPGHKVFVIPDGVDAANGQRYRDIYCQLLDRWATRGHLAAGSS